MGFLAFLILGLIAGAIAKLILPGKQGGGWFITLLLGVVGALLGGWLISPLVGVPTINQDAFSIGSLVVSLIGAIILLAIVNLFRRGKVRS